jgi:hypothetical protein
MERPNFYILTNKYYNINLSRNEIEAKVVKDIDDYIDYLENKLSEQQLLPELNKIDEIIKAKEYLLEKGYDLDSKIKPLKVAELMTEYKHIPLK